MQPSELTDESRAIPAWAPAAGVSALLLGVAFAVPPGHPGLQVAGLVAAAGPWLASVWLWRRGRLRGGVGAALALVIATRLALAAAPPALSPDAYRYAFEGAAQRLGAATPYLAPPASPRLAALRPPWFDEVRYPTLPSVYFPAAQWLFRLAARGPWPVRAVKALMALCDAATILLLAGWLARRGRDLAGAVIYGACPLAIAESSLAGHLDAAVALAVVAGLFALEATRRPRPILAGAALAAAALMKPPVAVVLVLVALRPGARGRSRAALLAGAAVAAALLWIPYLPAGTHVFDALTRYAAHWRAGDAAYAAILDSWRALWSLTGLDHAGPGGGRLYLHLHLLRGGLLFSGRATHVLLRFGALPAHPGFPAPGTALLHLGLWPETLARATAALLALAAVVAVLLAARRRPGRWPLPRMIAVALAAGLFLSPTAFPWYWLPVVALVPLAWWPAIAVLAASLPLHYLVALPQVGTADGGPWWLRALVYGPALVVAVAVPVARRWTARRGSGPAAAPGS